MFELKVSAIPKLDGAEPHSVITASVIDAKWGTLNKCLITHAWRELNLAFRVNHKQTQLIGNANASTAEYF